ncbi:MAG: hypothetical protein Q9226_006047 [Calogaya cf. arnoldii]
MLRLAPTRISLTSADLDWHVRRHEKRLAKVMSGKTTGTRAQGPKPRTKPPKYRPPVDWGPMPTSLEGVNPVPIYSDEPVPQDSEEAQPFWDGILAEVGAIDRGNQPSTFRSHPPNELPENNGSAHLSVQGQVEDDWSHHGPSSDLQVSPRSPEIHPLSPASSSGSWTSASTQIQSRQTNITLPIRHRDKDSTGLQSSDSSDHEFDPHSVVSNATVIQSTTSMQAHRTHSQHSWVNQMDVDGSSDTTPYLHHYRSTSSLKDPEPGLRGMPFGAQARRAELTAFRNASSSVDLETQQSVFDTPDRALRDGYSPSRSSEHMRTRSGGLPRSRLYISEVVASSSPEKRQRSVAGSDNLLLSNDVDILPIRVRKRYKRRDSSSFIGSEASDDHTHPAYSAYASENPFGGPPNSSPPDPISQNSVQYGSYTQYPYAPTTPASRSSSINLHPTHISIYNDDLPSYSQPQTPIGLPRNGLPRMYHQAYYTAPARQGGHSPRRARVAGNPDDFTTPTREGRQGVGVIGDGRPGNHNEQENVSVEIERERRERGMRQAGSLTGGSVRGWRISEWEP